MSHFNAGQQAHTQAEADRLFGADPGDLYFVQLPDHPPAKLPAESAGQAGAKYMVLCGVTASNQTPTIHLAEKRTAEAGLKELPEGDADGHAG